MDPNQPVAQTNATTSKSQPGAIPAQPTQAPISTGHPEGHTQTQRPEVGSVIAQERTLDRAERKATQKPLELTDTLKLEKEILQGVKEKHHVSEPIVLPSQVQAAGVSSVPIPIEANTYKPAPLVLPLDRNQMKQGLHRSVMNSIRWLAEWCVKQLKEAHLMTKRQLTNNTKTSSLMVK